MYVLCTMERRGTDSFHSLTSSVTERSIGIIPPLTRYRRQPPDSFLILYRSSLTQSPSRSPKARVRCCTCSRLVAPLPSPPRFVSPRSASAPICCSSPRSHCAYFAVWLFASASNADMSAIICAPISASSASSALGFSRRATSVFRRYLNRVVVSVNGRGGGSVDRGSCKKVCAY